MDAKLTDQQKAEILVHFQEWSGGFTPDECWDGEIRTYAATARITGDEEAVRNFLTNWTPE